MVTDCETEEDQTQEILANSWVQQAQCQRTGYENTPTHSENEK